MSNFSVTVQNQTNIPSIRLIGVSVNPNIRFSIDANQNHEDSQSNLQARGSRGIVVYDLGENTVIATGTLTIPSMIDSVTILISGNSPGQYAFDFAFG